MLMSPDDSNGAVEHALSDAIASKPARARKHTMQVTGLFALVDCARGFGVEFCGECDTNLPGTLSFTKMAIDSSSAFVV